MLPSLGKIKLVVWGVTLFPIFWRLRGFRED